MKGNEPYERVRLTVFMPSWVRTAFKQYAAAQGISMSQLLADMAEETVIDAGFKPPQKLDYNTMGELVQDNLELLKTETRITLDELEKIMQGECCNEITMLRIAIALDISEEDIRDLAKRSYNGNKEECCADA
ncbi:MAG: hypothetical protein WBA77_00675 [Microcoleaceae cyanobacterium]|jgi:hypothetical protein